ncbi:hypothetical protein PV375_08835 [Gulosibacter sp. GYB002]|uniref:hypothetical protein n=1 Tax=Gulosibacter sp. GYB002 TaxID=2994391 RepID=UPI002F967CB3
MKFVSWMHPVDEFCFLDANQPDSRHFRPKLDTMQPKNKKQETKFRGQETKIRGQETKIRGQETKFVSWGRSTKGAAQGADAAKCIRPSR